MKNACRLVCLMAAATLLASCAAPGGGATLTPISTPTTIPLAFSGQPTAPFPPNADNFLINGGGSTEQAWDTLTALAPNDVAAQRAYFNAEFARMGIPASRFELVPMYYFSHDVNAWVIAALDNDTGRYYIPAERHVDPATGNVTHIIISSLSLFPYEDHMPWDDFFDLIELKNPPQYPAGKQQLVADESGWFVIGLFDGKGKLAGYYDAALDAWKDPEGAFLANMVIATPTPDIPRPAISSNLSPQNNASIVLENGAWVTKNAAGKVTATWDSANSEWAYNYENIQMRIGIAEPTYNVWLPTSLSEETNITIPDEMLRPLDASQIDPNPFVPAGFYGTREQTTQKGIATYAKIGVDYRGIFFAENSDWKVIKGDLYVLVFTIQSQNTPDLINVMLVPIINTDLSIGL
jgi:hypothetical protein